jgi:hypothetical protein
MLNIDNSQADLFFRFLSFRKLICTFIESCSCLICLGNRHVFLRNGSEQIKHHFANTLSCRAFHYCHIKRWGSLRSPPTYVSPLASGCVSNFSPGASAVLSPSHYHAETESQTRQKPNAALNHCIQLNRGAAAINIGCFRPSKRGTLFDETARKYSWLYLRRV